MKLEEFAKRYCLHDSWFESIESDSESKTVTVTINFAFWMQDDYIEGTPETGIIKVVFHGVTQFSCNGGAATGDFVGILKNEFHDGVLTITLADDVSNDCFDMIIAAEDVSVSIL